MPSTIDASSVSATPAAASQWIGSPTPIEKAAARAPDVEAVSAAPTVPECSAAWPVFGPG